MSERRRMMMEFKESNTISLLHFDNTWNGKDACGNIWITDTGTLNINTSQKKFGNSSLYVNSNQIIKFDTGITWGTIDLTFEVWLRQTTQSTTYNWARLTGIYGSNMFVANADMNVGGAYRLYTKVGGSDIGMSPTLNTWHHFALTYNHLTDKCDVYLNGSRVATNKSPVWSGTYNTIQFYVGGIKSLTYVDEVRFSRKIRYTGNSYTVPTSAFEID